jgi:hypothetical protein
MSGSTNQKTKIIILHENTSRSIQPRSFLKLVVNHMAYLDQSNQNLSWTSIEHLVSVENPGPHPFLFSIRSNPRPGRSFDLPAAAAASSRRRQQPPPLVCSLRLCRWCAPLVAASSFSPCSVRAADQPKVLSSLFCISVLFSSLLEYNRKEDNAEAHS